MSIVSAHSAIGNLALCLQRVAMVQTLKCEILMESQQILHARPLLDTVKLFERLGINYALVGGIAAMYYGRSRFTEDVDFVAASGHEEILAQHPQDMRDCHFDATCTFKLYHDSGIDIDVWKDEFADGIVTRAQIVRLAEASVRIADLHDLIAMKLRAGRFQDDYDISELIKHTVIDEERLRALVTSEQMIKFADIMRRVKQESKKNS